MSLRIFPATDLHLLAGTSVDLRFFARGGGVWFDLAGQPSFGIGVESMTDGSVATVTDLGGSARVAATAVGSTLIRLELQWNTPPSPQMWTPIRATVHARLVRLLVPRPTLDLETNRTDRVLTVYGEFDDGGTITIGDVTRHPYITHTVAVTSGTPTVTAIGGRVSTGAVAGSVRVTIGVDPALGLAVPTATVDINVTAPPAERAILRRIHEGTAVRKRSILFLSEGFTDAEQGTFETLVDDITKQWLRIRPFSRLRESLDVYRAFVASAESGVSIGSPILPSGEAPEVGFSLLPDQRFANRTVMIQEMLLGNPANGIVALGLPTDPGAPATAAAAATRMTVPPAGVPGAMFHAWQSIRIANASRVRETFFGTLLGGRHGGSRAQQQAPAPAAPTRVDIDWLLDRGDDENIRSPFFDERRLPDLTAAGADPQTAHVAVFDAFLRTLRAADGPAGFGATWASGQPDAGLVVLLMNADHYGGVRIDSCVLLPIGGGIQHHVAASTIVPGLFEVAALPRPIGFWSDEHRLGFRERPIGSMADRVGHELGHAAGFGNLNDEYGGRRNPAAPDFRTFVDAGPNTQLRVDVATAAGRVDAARVRWNRWHRADAAAHAELLGGAGQRLVVTLVSEDMVRWPELAAGRVVVLRGKNLATNLPAPVTLRFQSADRAGQTVELEVAAPDTVPALQTRFAAGATLVVPRLDAAGNPVTMIDPLVGTVLAASGPFAASGAGCVTAATPTTPVVPGLGFSWDYDALIAAYETGAGADCGVIRPAVDCKMRTVVDMFEPPTDFCFVCKYAIVDHVDPGALGELDSEYPT